MPAPPPPPAYVWLAQPSARDIARAETAVADMMTRSGRAALLCVLRGDGRLDGCRVDEAKTDPGFGRPMLALSDKYLMDMAHAPADPHVSVGVAFPKLLDRPLKPTAAATPADWAALLPRGVEGNAQMICTVTPGGGAADCAVEAEPAHDPQLEAAALSLAPKFRFAPPTLGGRPTRAAAMITLTSDTHVIRMPTWAATPTAGDMSSFFPRIAQASGISGKAWIRCVVGRTGLLADCHTLNESPAALGFGDPLRLREPR